MSEKDSRDSFYFLNAYQDGITPGQKITIQHNVSYNDWRAAPHLAPLVKLTDAEINQRKEASITLEKELYAKLKQIASEWDEQAAHTAARFNERTEEQKLQNRPQTRQKKEELSR